MKYVIELNGCDDYTLLVMNITEDQLVLVQRMVDLSESIGGG